MTVPAAPTRTSPGRAMAGTALVAAGSVVVLALHVLAPGVLDSVRRTLSQYAPGPWEAFFPRWGAGRRGRGPAAVLAGLVRARVRAPGAALRPCSSPRGAPAWWSSSPSRRSTGWLA